MNIYNPATNKESEIILKRRTGWLKEKMRQLRDEFQGSLDFVNRVRANAIDKGTLDADFSTQIKNAIEDGALSKDEVKHYLIGGTSEIQKNSDVFYLKMLQLIAEPKDAKLKELWEEEPAKSEFWLNQDIVEVEQEVNSFRQIMGV